MNYTRKPLICLISLEIIYLEFWILDIWLLPIWPLCLQFSKELMGFIRSYGQTHLILLQSSWNLFYGLRVVRLTFLPNLKKIWKKIIFSEIYALCYIFYFYGPEIYRLYRTKFCGPVMIKLYKEMMLLLKLWVKVNIILQNLDMW